MKVAKIFSSMTIAVAALTFVLSAGAQGEIGRRQQNQQDRIANGVKNGTLRPGQTAHIEHQEGRIDRQVRNDRAADGGHLTPAEKAQVNHELNHTSREIYRDKHDTPPKS